MKNKNTGKKKVKPSKLYPFVYDEKKDEFRHVDGYVYTTGVRRHTRTEVPFGKGVAKARKGDV